MAYIQPPESDQCVWRRGKPPHIGWWPASICYCPTLLRWWDGRRWSYPAIHVSTAEFAALEALKFESDGAGIFWTDPWW
jgi:hypothetical protein